MIFTRSAPPGTPEELGTRELCSGVFQKGRVLLAKTDVVRLSRVDKLHSLRIREKQLQGQNTKLAGKRKGVKLLPKTVPGSSFQRPAVL